MIHSLNRNGMTVAAVALAFGLSWLPGPLLSPLAPYAAFLRLSVFAVGVLLILSLEWRTRRAERERRRLLEQLADEREQLAEAVRDRDESLALLNTFLATAPVGMAFLDRDLRYVRLNDALAAIHGVPRPDHLGRTLEEVLPWLAPVILPLLHQVLQTGEPAVNLELAIPPSAPVASDSCRHWLTTAYPVRTEDGHLLGVGLVVSDITERKRAEAALAERARLASFSAELFAALTWSDSLDPMLRRCAEVTVRHLRAARAKIWTLDPEQNALQLQASVGRPAGNEQAPEETKEADHSSPPASPALFPAAGRVAYAGYPLIVESRLVGVMEVFPQVPLTASGFETMAAVAHAIALAIERKRAEERLREQTRIAETLHRIGTLLAAELDVGRLVQVLTEEATRLTDARWGAFYYRASDGKDESFRLYALAVPSPSGESAGSADSPDRDRFPFARQHALLDVTFRGGDVLRLADVTQDPRHVPELRPSEKPAVRSYLAVPVVSGSGQVLGGLFFGHPEPNVFSPLDERLLGGIASQAAVALDNARLCEELRHRAEELAEEGRRKDEFLAQLGHELRNPLVPVRNALHILRLQQLPDPGLETLRDMMERQVANMARLVDDLLDVSRISRGKVELRREEVELAPLVDRVCAAVRPLMEERRHQLTVLMPPEPISLDADPLRLEQVLVNLLNNAARYTEEGGSVTLEAEVPTGASEVVLRVKDNGIGIRPEMLPRIFDLFRQADQLPGRMHEGLGIGLTLVRRLVELHGGTVQAHSPGPGKGSEFVVRLPVRSKPPRPAESRLPAGTLDPLREGPRRVLVVDDNVDGAESLALWLRLKGHEVRVAHEGAGALEMAELFHPQVVLLDIGMPGMNGYEVARRLRQQLDLRPLKLVAMTGYGQEEDRRRAREAGFDHHLVKPVDPQAVQSLVAAGPASREPRTEAGLVGSADVGPRERSKPDVPARENASSLARRASTPSPPGVWSARS